MRTYLSWKITGGVVLAGALAALPVATLGAQQSESDGGRSLTTHITYTSALDRGTRVLVSDHGNIFSFLSPSTGATYEHINNGSVVEGYVLCYTPAFGGATVAYDLGSFESGFGAANFPTAASIVRDTVDGQLRLKQTFLFSGGNKTVQVKMDVTNITNLTGAADAAIANVSIRRQVDFDIDSGGTGAWAGYSNRFFADTRDGATAWNDRVDATTAAQEAHALTLRHIAQNTFFPLTGRSAKVLNYADTSCNPAHIDTATGGYARTDLGAAVQYTMSATLGIGKTASATVMYVRH